MKKVVYCCDRCAKQLPEEQMIGIAASNWEERMDFCPECYEAFEDILFEFTQNLKPIQIESIEEVKEEPTEPIAEPVKEEKQIIESVNITAGEMQTSTANAGRRARIDIGKIIALRMAGWSIKDIAGEMKETPEAISNAIYRWKKKQGEEECKN